MARFILALILMISFPGLGKADLNQQKVNKLKKAAKQHLLERKKGFEAYLAKKEKAERRRTANAFKMKAIREAYREKKERVRRNFVREERTFPKEAYYAFLRKREQRRQEQEQARQNYVAVQDELDEVYENDKYRIDGEREFDL